MRLTRMRERYRVGFDRPETKSPLTDRNPGYFPVVDRDGIGALGTVIAIVDYEPMAHKIVALLNAGAMDDR